MESDVLYQIKSFENEIMRKSFERGEIHKYRPISSVQMRIIDYLFKHLNQDVYQKDLESFLNIRKSTLSGILDTMEKNQIIKRVGSVGDRKK